LARQANAELEIFTKPNDWEKPDGKTVRYASWEIVDALKEYCDTYAFGVLMECSSCDEVYLDITEEVTQRMSLLKDENPLIESRTFLEGTLAKIGGADLKARMERKYRMNHFDRNLLEEERLVYGGIVVQDINNHLFRKTKLKASAGIATNKLVAKLACGINKPNGITICTSSGLARLSEEIKISSIPGFGGKTGEHIQKFFGIQKMNQLAAIPFDELEEEVGLEKAFEAHSKCHGLYDEVLHI